MKADDEINSANKKRHKTISSNTITGGPRYSTNVRVQRLHRAAYTNRVISGGSNLTCQCLVGRENPLQWVKSRKRLF